MLIFKSIEYKNFLSTGNSGIKIELNKNHASLIIGKNGAGKSQFLDALTYALFNKPFRNVNKPQLVNSINGKKCLVTVEFDIDLKKYKIIRGMKPGIFEIWCNDELMNQPGDSRDYQKILEQQILKLNYKSFTQVVILGSAAFVPFMQLPASQRREVIEDILDIRIFSVMNQLLKTRIQTNKDDGKQLDSALNSAIEKVNSQKKIIETIAAAKESTIDNLESKIKEYINQISKAEEKQKVLQSDVTELIKHTEKEQDIRNNVRKAATALAQLETKKASIEDNISFFKNNSSCPSCDQSISDDHSKSTVKKLETVSKTFDNEKALVEKALDKLNDQLTSIVDHNKALNVKNIELSTINNTISMLNRSIHELNDEIVNHKSDTTNLDEEQDKLKKLTNNGIKLADAKKILSDRKSLHDIAGLLLKDTGIKTAIIREYLPIMNKLINKYLHVMDSYIQFELDESFNEIIKSRHRDEFTYASFSQGEKARIDISLLFAWRQIAKMKNSVNTNLLIFDETFDGALDTSGTDTLMNLLNQFNENTNIFVISHKTEALVDKFSNVIQIDKKNNFSEMSESLH